VKGGFSVRTLINPSPYTQDIDLLIDSPSTQELNKEKAHKEIVELVVDQITAAGEDYFRFKPTMKAMFEDLRPDQAVARIWVEAQIGDRVLGKVVIDAGIKAQDIPIDRIKGRDVLGFADIPNPVITTVAREYLIADKITLFLETGFEGKRPRDVVHAALLLTAGSYNCDLLVHWLEKFGAVRQVADKLHHPLTKPTADWLATVNEICRRYALKLDARSCLDTVSTELKQLYE
jgi:Nucleotidyl transferase AbiEii toxin, Type IV TA system